jgi:ferredoxin
LFQLGRRIELKLPAIAGSINLDQETLIRTVVIARPKTLRACATVCAALINIRSPPNSTSPFDLIWSRKRSKAAGSISADLRRGRKDHMRVRVDADRCVGHAMCRLACPEIFELSDEDGHAYVVQEDVPPDLDEAVQQAVRGCPEQAIITFE